MNHSNQLWISLFTAGWLGTHRSSHQQLEPSSGAIKYWYLTMKMPTCLLFQCPRQGHILYIWYQVTFYLTVVHIHGNHIDCCFHAFHLCWLRPTRCGLLLRRTTDWLWLQLRQQREDSRQTYQLSLTVLTRTDWLETFNTTAPNTTVK